MVNRSVVFYDYSYCKSPYFVPVYVPQNELGGSDCWGGGGMSGLSSFAVAYLLDRSVPGTESM